MKTNPKASDRDSVTAAVRHPFAAPAAECRGRTAFGGLGNTGKKRRGSALVWSMAVIIVLLVMVMIVAQVITASFRGTVESEVNTQAYYTARTVNERLVNWLSGAKWSPSYAVNLPSNPAPTDAQKFIKNLINGNGWAGGVATDDDGHTVVSEYGEADLGGSMGTADAKISVNYDDPDPDRQNRIITVETAGHFGDETKSVKTQLFLHTDSTYSYSFTSFLASGSAFSPAAAREKADELNAFTPDPDPVILGRYLYYNSGRKVINDDSMDIDTLAAANMTDEREAKWEHYYTDGTANTPGYPGPDVHGPYSPNAFTETYNGSQLENVRTFVAPDQGGGTLARMTFNPLRSIWPSDNSSNFKSVIVNPTAINNTRLSAFTFSNTAGKDVYLRLGGDMSAPERNYQRYNAIIGLDFVDQQTSTSGGMAANEDVDYFPNNQVVPATFTYSGSNISSVKLNFAGADVTEHGWYPQKWKSGTIFTQNSQNALVNAGVDTRLIFYPFYLGDWKNIHYTNNGYQDIDFSYLGYGSYVRNPNYGQSKGDLFRLNPNAGNATTRNHRGMASVPVYLGNDFSMYLLDNTGGTAADKANPDYRANMAWITQGVNVMNEKKEDGSSGGTIYSLRGLTIGGMPTRTKAWYTAEGVNVNGWVCDAFIEDDDSPSYISEYTMHIRYSQIIYNTDIVLETPNGAATSRKSAFKPALNYRNAWYNNANNTGDAYKTRREMLARYKPKTKIIGGHVYVGSGQTLTIYGGKQLYLNPGGLPAVSNDKPTGEYNMEVRPDSMTIATGASVSIETSENTNVDTEIYVSGSLKLKAGSNVKGTIFVEKDGSLVMDGGGTFTGDIYVKNGGTINIGGGTVINGDVYCAGQMMITGSITVNHPAVMENDPNTEADESQPALHGIYIMHSPVTGNGSLTLAGTGMVSGSSGKIHSIAGYPSITGAPADAVFCDNKDKSNNACEHWKTEIGSWQKQVSANG